MVGLWGSGLTQMRGLWRCPERLSYALAVESGMCSGTETVFSTGLWRISVRLDKRAVRSLGWHSVDQRLTRGSGSSGALLAVTAASLNCLVWNLGSHRRTKEEDKTLLMVAMPHAGAHHQAVARAQRENDGMKRWAAGPRLQQCIWSQFGVNSQPQDYCWGPSGGSLNQPQPPRITHTRARTNYWKYFQFKSVVRGREIAAATGNRVQTSHAAGHAFSVDTSTKRHV